MIVPGLVRFTLSKESIVIKNVPEDGDGRFWYSGSRVVEEIEIYVMCSKSLGVSSLPLKVVHETPRGV